MKCLRTLVAHFTSHCTKFNTSPRLCRSFTLREAQNFSEEKEGRFMSESKPRTQSTDFAVSIIGLVKSLEEKHETIISNQIGRSGSFRLFSLLICHLYVLHQFFQRLAFFLPQRVSLLGVAQGDDQAHRVLQIGKGLELFAVQPAEDAGCEP